MIILIFRLYIYLFMRKTTVFSLFFLIFSLTGQAQENTTVDCNGGPVTTTFCYDTGADNSTKGQKGEVGEKGAAGAANANADEIYMTRVVDNSNHAVLLSDESATASSGYKAVNYDYEFSYNPSTNLLTALKARIDIV